MAFPWRANDGPTLNVNWLDSNVIVQGIRTSIVLRNPIFSFVICQGGPDPQYPSPLDPRMTQVFT